MGLQGVCFGYGGSRRPHAPRVNAGRLIPNDALAGIKSNGDYFMKQNRLRLEKGVEVSQTFQAVFQLFLHLFYARKGITWDATSHVAGGVGRAAPQNKAPTSKNLYASFPNILSCFFKRKRPRLCATVEGGFVQKGCYSCVSSADKLGISGQTGVCPASMASAILLSISACLRSFAAFSAGGSF